MKNLIVSSLMLCLSVSTALAQGADKETNLPARPSVTVEKNEADGAIAKAMGVRHLSQLRVSIDGPHMLNVELRWYDSEGQLDRERSRGEWRLSSEPIEDHPLILGVMNAADLTLEDVPSRYRVISSLDEPVWLDPTWEVAGLGDYVPPTFELYTDTKLIFASLRERRRIGRDRNSRPIPERPEGWEPATQRMEIVVRVEAITADQLKQFPFLKFPKSSTSYPYMPGWGDRFYPWLDKADRTRELDEKE